MILREGIELYHASYKVVDKIDLSCCSEGKDFGKGFYLTSDFGQACKFVKTSIKKALVNGVDVENDRMGYVSVYKFERVFDELSVYEFPEANREWLSCVTEHRKRVESRIADWDTYDIIVGKIANDTTNQVLTAYINGLYGEIGSDLADETAIRMLFPNKLSDQICLKSGLALKCFCFLEAKEVRIDESK